MRARFVWILSLVICLLLAGCTRSPKHVANADSAAGGTISVSGAFALYPLVLEWSSEYGKLHPGVRLDVSAGGAGKGVADALSGLVDLGMVSRELFPQEVEKGAIGYAVAKDAVLVIANRGNPLSAELERTGISKRMLGRIFLDADHVSGFNVYTRADSAGAADVIAQFLGAKWQGDLVGTGVVGDPGIVQAVASDPRGIGYGNLNFIYDASTRRTVDNVMVVPLDVNDDGVITSQERFYATRDELSAAIGRGSYPSPPARDLYLVSRGEPRRAAVRDFLLWILTDGQQYLDRAGYNPVADATVMREIQELGQ